jgi:hypothetical protein
VSGKTKLRPKTFTDSKLGKSRFNFPQMNRTRLIRESVEGFLPPLSAGHHTKFVTIN